MSTTTATDESLLVEMHPGRLSGGELDLLASLAFKVRMVSLPYADWIAGIVEIETIRRLSEDTDVPTEPQLPRLACIDWTAAELGDALAAAFAAAMATEGLPAANELIQKSHAVLIAWLRSFNH